MSLPSDLEAEWRRRLDAPPIDSATVGWIGLDTPVEVISACGLTPLRVIAAPASEGAEDFAEGAGNPVLRALAAALIEGPYSRLETLVISPTPAANGWLFNFLTDLKRQSQTLAKLELYLLDLNHGAAPGLAELRRTAVEKLAARVEGWAGRKADLPAAIARENRRRGLLRRVEALRAQRKVGGAEALAAFSAEDALLEQLIAQERPALPGRPTVYSGTETFGPEVYGRIDGLIVGDDQDAGSRSIGPDVAKDRDPLAALAERYAHRSPAPAKSGLEARLAWLTGLVKAQGAERVVFDVPRFDHPAGWEAPFLKRGLKDQGIEVADV